MECYICQEVLGTCKFSQNPLIKNLYPDKVNACIHSFCEECLGNWIVSCLNEGNDFNCPVCRFVYFTWDRLYHLYNLFNCFKEYKLKKKST
jgi:hypothetical protein